MYAEISVSITCVNKMINFERNELTLFFTSYQD